MCQPRLAKHAESVNAFGHPQFAYRPQLGSRDARAHLACEWLWASRAQGCKLAVFSSDVSGAFDKMDATRLTETMKLRGFCQKALGVVAARLEPREAVFVCGRAKAQAVEMQDAVYHGTALCPCLWVLHYADVEEAVEVAGFHLVVYAGDLTGWRSVENEKSVVYSEVSVTSASIWCTPGDKPMVFASVQQENTVW
jgi:hypothetical protein